jgi:hypothetical protein
MLVYARNHFVGIDFTPRNAGLRNLAQGCRAHLAWLP